MPPTTTTPHLDTHTYTHRHAVYKYNVPPKIKRREKKNSFLTKDDSLRFPAMCVDRTFQCQLFLWEKQTGCTDKKLF